MNPSDSKNTENDLDVYRDDLKQLIKMRNEMKSEKEQQKQEQLKIEADHTDMRKTFQESLFNVTSNPILHEINNLHQADETDLTESAKKIYSRLQRIGNRLQGVIVNHSKIQESMKRNKTKLNSLETIVENEEQAAIDAYKVAHNKAQNSMKTHNELVQGKNLLLHEIKQQEVIYLENQAQKNRTKLIEQAKLRDEELSENIHKVGEKIVSLKNLIEEQFSKKNELEISVEDDKKQSDELQAKISEVRQKAIEISKKETLMKVTKLLENIIDAVRTEVAQIKGNLEKLEDEKAAKFAEYEKLKEEAAQNFQEEKNLLEVQLEATKTEIEKKIAEKQQTEAHLNALLQEQSDLTEMEKPLEQKEFEVNLLLEKLHKDAFDLSRETAKKNEMFESEEIAIREEKKYLDIRIQQILRRNLPRSIRRSSNLMEMMESEASSQDSYLAPKKK